MTDKTNRNRYYLNIKGRKIGFYKVSDAKKYAVEHKEDFFVQDNVNFGSLFNPTPTDKRGFYSEVVMYMGKKPYGVYVFGGNHLYKVYSCYSNDKSWYQRYMNRLSLYDESEVCDDGSGNNPFME